ncbi:tripartite tricarboxylate transporter substrate binding protein [Teichococcus aerofrigidensis]
MTPISRRGVLLGAAALPLAGTALARPALAQTRYPVRPLQLICPWGAGGGTDATARIVASLLERELGQPVNVVNRTGGSGVVGHAAINASNPDGYTIGIITVEITMMHWQGLTPLTYADYTPLGLVNRDAPGVQVSASAPYKDIKALAEAIRAAPPGKLKASGTGQGGIWHLALVGWLQAMGLKPDHVRWVPSNGAAPGMQDLVAGGIDIVPCSIPEARAMLDAGRARSLAIMAPQRDPLFPDIPTLKESLGVEYQTAVWRGIGGPPKLPAEIAAKLTAALEKVAKSEQYAEFMKSRGFGMDWADGAGFGKVMAETDKAMGEAMRAAGLAKS